MDKETGVDEDKKKAEAKEKAQKAFDLFFEEWWKLPPLVRASAACHLVETLNHKMDALGRDLFEITREMPRRARVHRLFMGAYIAMKGLVTDLTNQADDEAETAQEDRDLRYEGDRDFLMEAVVQRRRARAVESQVLFESYSTTDGGAIGSDGEG